mgnify:CR=1
MKKNPRGPASISRNRVANGEWQAVTGTKSRSNGYFARCVDRNDPKEIMNDETPLETLSEDAAAYIHSLEAECRVLVALILDNPLSTSIARKIAWKARHMMQQRPEMKTPVCIRHKNGWCATKKKSLQYSDTIKTLCDYFISLPIGIARRMPDCPECLSKLYERNKFQTRRRV